MPSTELFSLCEKKNADGIISFISSESNKNQKARKLRETLSSCQQRDVSDMWTELYSMTTEAIMSLDEDEEKMSHTFSLLECVVFIARATLHNEKDPVPPCLFETAVLLHGVLMSLPEEALGLRSDIAQLLEVWWRRGLEGKEEVAVNTLHFFLESAQAAEKVTAVKVKRVWAMHEAVLLINWDNDEMESFKQRLLACVAAKPFLREPDGRKFLAFLFNISPEFTGQLYVRFKEFFPGSTRDMSTFYGEVFFRAWKQASGPCLEKLENDCIQNLMNHAVHARRDGTNIFSLLSRLLQYLHNQKIQTGVTDMLLKLYNPILWRSLNVPNCDVRANATFLLCDVFPLTCPIQKDELINRQCEALLTALYDDYPVARRIAVEGVCRIMSSYWELLPNLTIKMFITKLLQDHLNDANSAEVRLSVVRGLTDLLDNHLCHPLLKQVLPTMRDHVHDMSESVRKAMMDLLLKVKKIRAIKFWTIVPVEHLLARLKEDSAAVCKKIVKLLINSYMPLEQTTEEKISRLTHLIKEDAGAARKFFQYAPTELKFEESVKYLTLLSRVMLVLIKRNHAENSNENHNESTASSANDSNANITNSTNVTRDDSSNQNTEAGSDDDEEQELSLKNSEIMMGLIEAMYLMWDAISKQLHTPQHTDVRHELQKRYSVIIPQMLRIFQEPRAYAAIMLLSGFLPSTRVPVLSDSCMSKLRNMTADTHMGVAHLQNFIGTLCKWRFSNALLEMIATSVEAGLEEKTIAEYKPGGSTVKKKTGAKCVMLKETIKPEPPISLEYLEILLEKDLCREVILVDHLDALTQTMEALGHSVDILKAMNSADSETSPTNEDFVLKTFFLYLRVSLLLHKQEETDPKPQFTDLLTWAQEELVPQLQQQGKRSRKDGELAFKTLQIILKMSWHLMMVGSADKEFTSKATKLCISCLEEDRSLRLVDSVLTCLQWVTDARRTLDRETNSEGQLLALIPNFMGKVFVCLASYIKHNKQTCQEVMSSIKPQLTEIFNTAMKNVFHYPSTADMMTATLMAIVAELTHASHKENLDEPVDISSLPVLSALLMKIMFSPRQRLHFFLQELNTFISSGSVPDLHHAHGCAHLFSTIRKTKGRVPFDQLENCEDSLRQCVNTLSVKIEEDDEDSKYLLKQIRDKMEGGQQKS
ncbi:condensin-2 complex subunit G2-like [Haliotis rubra]|uniref:condensin-2 complex subunit G2-like n=1 Tax=Haliotis rubra TaxID=36100 RepID=UPI001EE628ED|nr:condensin-2 complex subunit G2-like [Haliotis rubra]XP_046568011.1 condensin-2 complex subunit G2-like [Haliotis rubra]